MVHKKERGEETERGREEIDRCMRGETKTDWEGEGARALAAVGRAGETVYVCMCGLG